MGQQSAGDSKMAEEYKDGVLVCVFSGAISASFSEISVVGQKCIQFFADPEVL